MNALVPHEERAHSKLGASSAYRWINCPGSVAATEGLESDSIYAAEGTAAHELAERLLKPFADEAKPLAATVDAIAYLGAEIPVGNHVFEVGEEMAEAVQLYVDTILADHEPGDVVYVEKRFSLEAVRPGMFGTNDFLRYRPSSKRLIVYDYKHGVRVVNPEANPQLLYYALGAALSLGLSVADVELVIIQPRALAAPVRRWTTDLLELLDFANVVGEAADRALTPNAPLIAGPWCKETFCPAAGTCPAYRELALAAAQMEFMQAPAATLSDERLAEILDEADLIRDWINQVYAEATRRAEAGRAPPGYKMVPSRALRRWIGTYDVLAETLMRKFRLTPEQVAAEPKLKSPAQLEKLLPKAERTELAEFYVKASSGAVLAKDTDPRAEIVRTTALEDFTA